MKSNPFVNCTQSMSILDVLGQKVRFSTNTRTTSPICVLLNCISSGLADKKKTYIVMLHMQGFRLQRNQCRILYAFLTNTAMLALFLHVLLMACVTLASTLRLHLKFNFLIQSLPKSIRNVALSAIQPMAVIRATLIIPHSSIHCRDLLHSSKTPTKAPCRN